jgi:hypothetical protein
LPDVLGSDHGLNCSHLLSVSTWHLQWFECAQILAFEDAYRHADLLGITAYLTTATSVTSAWATRSVPDVFRDLYAALPFKAAKVAAQAAVAAQFNLSTIAYEAGPGLVEDGVIEGGGATGAVTSLLIAVARDPAMQATATPYLSTP